MNRMKLINNRKKTIGICVAIIVLLIIVVGVVVALRNREQELRNYEIEEIAEIEYQYFLLHANGKYGVIDTKGNILIDTKYDEIIIPNPTKGVFICSNEGDTKNTILDENGKEIFTIYDNVEAIDLEGIVTSLPYEKNVLKFEVNGQYGLVDFEGNRIIKAIYDDIGGLKYKEGELIVKLDDKYGVININGTKLVDIKYDGIEGDKYYIDGEGYTKSGYIVCMTTDEGYRYGYISNSGEEILDIEYNRIDRITDIESNDIYFIASNNGQYGLLKNKDVIIDFKYQGLTYNSTNNLLIVNKGTKYGVYTLTGDEILPINYKTVQFNGIYIYAKTGSDISYFTTEGKEVTTGFTSLIPVGNGDYYISIDGNGLYGVVDKDLNVLIDNNYVYAEYMFDDYFSVYKNESGLGIINTNGEMILDFQYTIINKISNTELIKTEDMTNGVIEIYSRDLEQIACLSDAELDIKDTYMKLYNDDTTIYIDMEGQIINEKTALESSTEAPDTIGDYIKSYYGYSQVYYALED